MIINYTKAHYLVSILAIIIRIAQAVQEKLPLVSVIMSSYNRGPYLQRAIESIFNSTYTNWEIVIVDDGSHK